MVCCPLSFQYIGLGFLSESQKIVEKYSLLLSCLRKFVNLVLFIPYIFDRILSEKLCGSRIFFVGKFLTTNSIF